MTTQNRPLTKTTIDAVFADAQTQEDYIVGLYQCVYPDEWKYIQQLDGWPTVNSTTNNYIMRKAMEFDRTVVNAHRGRQFGTLKVMEGGAWMNSGFHTDDLLSIQDWEVRPCSFTLTPDGKLSQHNHNAR